MKTGSITLEDLRGVFSVPPLARKNDARRALDLEENERIVNHIAGGGITRFLYGGNAFLYHIKLGEYEQLLNWLSGLDDDYWAIPSAGPSYGRAMDQAAILQKFDFPCVMMLPCGDPRDAAGIEQGLREFADAAETKLVLYLKDENNFGADKEAGLDVVARLVDEGICTWIKYAVVRDDPRQDAYLESLLTRVDRARVVSGIGERPAIVHMRDWKLQGFTTGSGCIAPRASQSLFEACTREDYAAAETLRARFIAHEDLRDAWSPAKVLHHATELADIARTGPVPPFLSTLPEERLRQLQPIAIDLLRADSSV